MKQGSAEEQFYELKKKYPDCILLFRMGDFYEVFDDDAKKMSRDIGLTLTSRDRGEVKRAMAGIPHHALNQYLGKIVKLGYKVAIAEQMEDPKKTKGVVKRDVVKVVTAANLIDDKNLNDFEPCYLLSINHSAKNQELYFAYLETSTGEFVTSKIKCEIHQIESAVRNILKRISPKEILIPAKLKQYFSKITEYSVKAIDDYEYDLERNSKILLDYYKTHSLIGFGLEQNDELISVLGSVLNYFKNLELATFSHVQTFRIMNLSKYAIVDATTIKNLELLTNISTHSVKDTSLYHSINRCTTAMGKRKLRSWITSPLIDPLAINERYDKVKCLMNIEIHELLTEINDIERISGRIGMRTINPKDLIALKNSLIQIKNVFEIAVKAGYMENRYTDEIKRTIVSISELIDSQILPEPSTDLKQGNVINSNVSDKLDELRNIQQNAKTILLEYQSLQIKNTGISNLKVKYTNVFGYFIEISKSNISKVPDNYARRQTLVNAERYVTEELKEIEYKILTADEQIHNLETELYNALIVKLIPEIPQIQMISEMIGDLDCLHGFAIIAKSKGYTKPVISKNHKYLMIKNARHPVVEDYLDSAFTPNDILFKDTLINVVTGPNMSGKSTYIRMVAIIIIMAQIGSFVPAEEMEYSIVDRIFTRVGASDNLASGESTFMVEMNETANILNSATEKSLIILDEVGRGTSTYDGLSLATAVVIYIYDKLKSITLFATHYHELTKLASRYQKIKNLTVKVLEKDGEVIFTHKIIEGASEKSFGIHVAELAGIPKEVINTARTILNKLETKSQKSEKSDIKSEQQPLL